MPCWAKGFGAGAVDDRVLVTARSSGQHVRSYATLQQPRKRLRAMTARQIGADLALKLVHVSENHFSQVQLVRCGLGRVSVAAKDVGCYCMAGRGTEASYHIAWAMMSALACTLDVPSMPNQKSGQTRNPRR